MAIEKSGGGEAAVTFTTTFAVCESDPELPANIAVCLLACAVAAAVSVTACCAPGESVKELGCAVTPAGSPDTDTFTLDENEPVRAAVTVTTCPGAPGFRLTVSGNALKEKSPTTTTPEPPQPAIQIIAAMKAIGSSDDATR
jgi:hypothetical protein